MVLDIPDFNFNSFVLKTRTRELIYKCNIAHLFIVLENSEVGMEGFLELIHQNGQSLHFVHKRRSHLRDELQLVF